MKTKENAKGVVVGMAGNKKKAPQQATRATKSFDQMVADASLERLKPYINDKVEERCLVMMQQFAVPFLDQLNELRLNFLALKKVLSATGVLSEDGFAEALMDEEDRATGQVRVTTPAETNDMVRFTAEFKLEDGKFGPKSSIRVYNLLKKDRNGNVQTQQDLEEALCGMVEGSSKEVTLKTRDEKEEVYRLSVQRVSRVLSEGGENSNEG